MCVLLPMKTMAYPEGKGWVDFIILVVSVEMTGSFELDISRYVEPRHIEPHHALSAAILKSNES